MISSISELTLNRKQHKLFRRLKKKFPVSLKFLSANLHGIKKYLLYSYSLHGIVYRKYAIRNKHQRVIIHYRRFRGLVFERKNVKWIKQRQRRVRQWSAQVVSYLKRIGRITEHEEMEVYDISKSSTLPAEEVSKQLKEQLELLKSGKRVASLMETIAEPVESVEITSNNDLVAVSPKTISLNYTSTPVNRTEVTPEKQKLCNNGIVEAPAPAKLYKQSHTEKSMDSLSMATTANTENVPSNGGNFLDMLMNKVRVKTFANVSNFDSQQQQQLPLARSLSESTCNDGKKGIFSNEAQNDSCDEEFVGFDEITHQPGMMLTPLVPKSSKTLAGNAAFVSESLNEYMRQNNLCESNEEPPCNVKKKTVEQVSLEGLVTPDSEPPQMDMPAVPESLQKLRTVAKRREYLQKFPKTHKMVLINNEATIYRELQRKIRQQKVKAASMQMLQSLSTQMPFTRDGWQAASYVATEYNKYYYQTISVDDEIIKLTGTMGNNDQREKKSYLSYVKKSTQCCGIDCVDAMVWRDFKIIKSKVNKAKLNKLPLPPVFRPCPLSHKASQKPMDDDTAALLLAGGSMAVVSMPTVELQVFPESGKPLNEIAKRYLQYILPHHDISREWAKFSVSTLSEPNKTAAAVAGHRESFTFAIPYINDRKQILVRRVVDRSEKLDESFEQAQIQDTASLLNDLSFRANVNPKDRLEMECADVLSDMINSVAISCSENSFIREDPDGLKLENILKGDLNKVVAETKQQNGETLVQDSKRNENKTASGKHNPANRQQRLRLELRRLNATIIETAARNENDNKPCSMPSCQLGCVCESKAGSFPLREHCGKAACVLECFCKSTNLSRIVRFETDGCGISNEDAFMLRRKATARLAPMEKEFTSTVVLTENETLLINESQRDKKRRCTKAPKRYDDFADTDDDFLRTSPKKSHSTQQPSKGSVMAIDTLDPSIPKSSSIAKIMDLREPCSVKEQDFEKLKHCTIQLRRLPDMSNVVPLCMTHQLYKCFCDGKALEGRPIVLEKEVANTATCPKITYAALPAAKASYSFDKVERSIDNRKHHHSSSFNDNAEKTNETSSTQTNVLNNKLLEVSKLMKNKETCVELEVISKYMNANQNICRRAVRIPSKCFTTLNKKRRPKVFMSMSNCETRSTHIKLLRHMHEASVHYRKEMEKERQRNATPVVKLKNHLTETTTNIIELQDDDDDDDVPPCGILDSNKTSLPTTSSLSVAAPSSSSSVQSNSLIKRKNPTNLEDYTKQTPAPKIPKLLISSNKSGRSLLKSSNSSSNSSHNDSQIQVPRIAACYSLSTINSDNVPSPSVINAIIPSPIVPKADVSSSSAIQIRCGEAIPSDNNQPNYKDFYQDVVKNMNSLVSKKMQDIDMALQRDSKLIPAPNEEILCIIKWTNFLDAFESGFVFIWDVKMRNYNFLAATVTNMMPIVCGAVGVVNIVGLNVENLPFLAQNLLQHTRTKFTQRLAIVMQGRKHYWVVKGHLLHTLDNACTRPTPQTHPLLTKKINLLCSQLVKQRIREKQRKQGTAEIPSLATISPSVPTIILQTTPPPLVASSVSQSRSQITGPELQGNTPPTHTSSRRSTNESTVSQSGDQPQPSPQDHSTLKIKSNIEFRSVSQGDLDQLMLPERHNEDHRWLVLELHNDFSHIFVPAFRDMISLDRIHNVMAVSRDKNKIVKLQFFQNAPYDAFVTPASKYKIYFGPLKLNMTPPLLVLLQSVDGKMMLREVYQRQHSIFINPENRTTAFWVLYVNGEISFELGVENGEGGDNGGSTPKSSSLSLLKQPLPKPGNQTDPKPPQNDSDSDDDCMIIDDDLNQASSSSLIHTTIKPSIPTTEHQRLNFSIQQVSKDNVSVIQMLPALAPATSSSTSDPPPTSILSNLLMQLPPIPNATTPVTSEMGFIPLVNSIPGNAIISVAPTSSSYIISPIASTTSATTTPTYKEPTKRLAKVVSNVQQTYLTPDVQMTSTTEPESFTETPPPNKISRISINTSSRINNNKGIKQPQTQNAVPKDSSTIEIKKTTVGCTTITRLNDGNKKSATNAVNEVSNVNSNPTPVLLNGKDLGTPTVSNGIKSKQTLPSSSNSTAVSSTTLALDVGKKTTSTSAIPTKAKKNCLPLSATSAAKSTKTYPVKILPKPDGSGKQSSNYSIQIGQQQQANLFPTATNSSTVNVSTSKAKKPVPPDGGTINTSSDIRLQQLAGGRRSAPSNINQMGSLTSNKKKDGPVSNSNSLLSKLKLPTLSSASSDTSSISTSVKHKKQYQDTTTTKMNLEFDDRYDHDDDDDEKVDAKVTKNNRQPNKAVVSFEYGYIWAPQMPKFVVKIVDDEYIIKVPKIGILRMKGLTEVVEYLNNHCIDKSSSKVTWKYYLQKRVTQIRQTTEKDVMDVPDTTEVTSSSNTTGELENSSISDEINLQDFDVELESPKKPKTYIEKSSADSILIED